MSVAALASAFSPPPLLPRGTRAGHAPRRGTQARAELSTAIEMYREMEMTFWLLETEAILTQLE